MTMAPTRASPAILNHAADVYDASATGKAAASQYVWATSRPGEGPKHHFWLRNTAPIR